MRRKTSSIALKQAMDPHHHHSIEKSIAHNINACEQEEAARLVVMTESAM